jgi:hypothetical protein
VSDEDFKNYFLLKQFNTNNSTDKKLVRYTLYKLESQEEGGSLYDFETDNETIEHILPESFPENGITTLQKKNMTGMFFCLVI